MPDTRPGDVRRGLALVRVEPDARSSTVLRWFGKGGSPAVHAFTRHMRTGDLAFVGYLQHGKIDFGRGVIDAGRSGIGVAFVVKLDRQGRTIFSHPVAGSVRLGGIAFDEAGNLYVVGHVWGSVALAGETAEADDKALSLFVAKLRP